MRFCHREKELSGAVGGFKGVQLEVSGGCSWMSQGGTIGGLKGGTAGGLKGGAAGGLKGGAAGGLKGVQLEV